MPDHRKTTLLRRLSRTLLRLLLALAVLAVLAVGLLFLPAVQTTIAHRALAALAEKTHTRITLGSLEAALPGTLVLHELFVEGQRGDTLLRLGTLEARVALLPLLSRQIRVQSLWVDSVTARIRRSLPDSNFNFQFLADSLAGVPPDRRAAADTAGGTPWAFVLGTVGLHAVDGSYDDAVAGLRAGVQLGLLRASFTAFDLKERRFHCSDIALEQTRASVVAGPWPPAAPGAAPEGPPLDLSAGQITLTQLRLHYADSAAGDDYNVAIAESRLQAKSIDLPSRRIALSSFTLARAGVTVARRRSEHAAPRAAGPPAPAGAPWAIRLDRLLLTGDTVRYDLAGTPRKAGLDPNHLAVTGLELQAEAIAIGERRAAATVRQGAFRTPGLELRALAGALRYDSSEVRLDDLRLETAASRLRTTLRLAYPSPAALSDDPGAVTVSAVVRDSRIGLADLRFLLPSLPLNRISRAALKLSARLSGPVRDLRLETLRLAAGDSTFLDVTGSLRGLPAWRTMDADLVLHAFATGRADIQALLAAPLIPQAVALPASLRLSGTFKGSRQNFSASAGLVSSFGRAHATAAMIAGSGAEPTRWTTDCTVQDFDLGALLKNPSTFGPLTLEISANGSGLSADSVRAQMIANVDRAVFRGYPYQNISLRGTAGSRMFQGKIQVDDPNLACTFEGTVNTGQEPPTYKFTFELGGADLYRLHLASQDLRVAGTLTSDLAGRTIDDVNGGLDLRNAVIMKGGRRYLIDSLVCTVVNRKEETHISVASPLLTARFDGTMSLGTLPDALEDHFERYFSFHPENERGEALPGPQAFTFQVLLRDPRTLTQLLLPEVRRMNAGSIEGSYNSATRNLNITVAVPTAMYNDIRLDSLTLTLASTAERLQARLRARTVSDSSFQVSNLLLAGTAAHDSLGWLVQSTGANGETRMLLAGKLTNAPDGYRVQLDRDGVVWQNRRWTVAPDGYLLLGKGRLLAHNFAMEGMGESIALDSRDDGSPKPPLTISFASLQLGTLLQAAERDTGIVRGLLNGRLELRHLDASPTITSDLTIRDLILDRQPVGNLALRVDNQGGEVYAVDLQMSGNGNQVTARGTYRAAAGNNAVDLKLDFQRLNLASVEPFASGAVQRLSGVMTGAVTVTGTTANPSLEGTLNFANAAFTPNFLGSHLHLSAGEIGLGGKTVSFRSFNLTDTLGNPGSIAGNLSTEDFRSFLFDLRVHTENFLILNRPASPAATFFGTVNLDSDISVKGTQTAPAITVRAVLNKGTDLVVVRQESEANVQRNSGIVTFVDRRHPPNPILTRSDTGKVGLPDSLRQAKASLTLASNIEVGKDTRFRLLVDPVAGDSLVVQGEGTFSFSIDPSGKLTLTGRYELSGGSYDFSFGQLIKRRFDIQQGSSITWFGSPLDANVDITAIYSVRASALDLVQNQLAALSQEERNKYRQPLPVQVYLMMGGRLTAPDIHFRLDLPADQRGVLGGTVYARLTELNSEESELNKQVFALLILGGFISENPLAAGADGGGLTGIARSSVSQILTEQLNRLSARYITGVNLNVGVQSYQDYSTGAAAGRTQLQLALSTKLFNERVTVQAGGNVELEGPRTEQNSLNTFAGDLKVSYNLTEDGRWQLEVFRQNNYEGLIEGELTETGAGIVFTIDYDKLFGITLKPAK